MRNRYRHNLVLEPAILDGVDRPPVAFERIRVLALARDLVLLGDQFRRHAHVEVLVGVPETVHDHGIEDLGVPEAVPATELRQQVRSVGHRLHAARHDEFHVAGLDSLGRQPDGLESRAADLVDGHRGHAGVESALESRLARRVLPQPRRNDVAHDNLVHLGRLDAGAGYGLADYASSEIDGGK